MVARELIMPTTHGASSRPALWFNDYRYLARLFGVAEGAMLERMRELHLVQQPEGIIWDY